MDLAEKLLHPLDHGLHLLPLLVGDADVVLHALLHHLLPVAASTPSGAAAATAFAAALALLLGEDTGCQGHDQHKQHRRYRALPSRHASAPSVESRVQSAAHRPTGTFSHR